MLVFIGDQSRGYFIEEVAKKNKLEFLYLPQRNHINQHTNEILSLNGCNYMVYDIEQYIDSSEEIAEEILRISKANNAKPIIFAKGYIPEADIIMRLYERNIKNIIFSLDLSGQKDELEKCINGYFDANDIGILKETELAIEQEKSNRKEFKRIGVAGSYQRIGTTTQAIQIVKYLMLNGYKACYIEMNDKKYVKLVAFYFEVEEHDKEIGKVIYDNTHMFYRPERISDILKMGYDYYVYDYGVYTDTSFNKTSFLEKDTRVFVVGSKADEMRYTTDIIENTFYDDIFYIYNFTPDADQASISDLMEEKRERTFFSAYAPDPFVYSNCNIYQEIVPIEEKIETVSRKKKGWWKKK